jgi:2-keto-myo-inositol isomerase
MKLAMNQATLMKTSMDIFLDAISKAGFKGVELRRDETFKYLKNHSIRDLRGLLERHELECVTFNAIELFSLCSKDEFNRILEYTERLMDIGCQIGCDTIIAVPSFIEESGFIKEKIISQTVERLKIITNLAKKYDFKVGFEPLGFHNYSVRKLDLALEIIEHKDLPDIGLVVDTFHFFLGEHEPKDLKSVDIDKIWLIHLNDSLDKPINELQDSDRVLPSEGFFPLKEFYTTLVSTGYSGWISLELFNEKMWKDNPYEVARKTMNSINTLL